MLFKDLCAVGRIPLLREAGKAAEGRMGCGKQDWYDEMFAAPVVQSDLA